MAFLGNAFGSHLVARWRAPAVYAAEFCLVAIVYFVLAKLGLALASINPSATPIWPSSGFALAAVLLRGYRTAPAILIAAYAVNAMTTGAVASSLAIGIGNMSEALVGAWLLNRWSSGSDWFASPGGITRFSLLSFLPTMLSASIGVAALAAAGFATWAEFGSIWLTWWLGDLAGILVVTPVVVLWAPDHQGSDPRRNLTDSVALFAGTCLIGLVAFSPLIQAAAKRAPLAFLAILPLLWSALRRGQRDTATVALILSAFAVWGTMHGGGPFDRETLNESFLWLLMFMISTAVPSLALSADVAVRKETEAELRRIQEELNHRVAERTAALTEANRVLQEAQRLAKIGSWVRDLKTDEVTWSDQLYEIYGVRPGEFGGSFDAVLRQVHPDDRERVLRDSRSALQAGHGFQMEKRIIRPNGEVRHLQNSVELVRDENGEIVRMIGISQDITDHREAAAALERTREQLAQVHKMEAIGQLTGGIAHDFNNLLMIVSGHAELLKRRLSDPKQLQSMDAIAAAARRGESLTRQLLTFSRRQPLNPVAIDLKRQIESVTAMLRSSLRGDITLVIDIPADVWPVEVDVAELELALVNIAVNARDAMPDGGTFTVRGRNVTANNPRSTQPAGDHVELTLSDTGVGIPPDVVKKIFDPFFTTKAVGKGTGLGLSQVYGFAHHSGGAVAVESEVGRGTTISLRLPRSRAQVMTNPDAVESPNPARAHGTILVVEDNAEVGNVTATLLEQIGYRVLRADSAADALRTLQKGDKVDLVFSDIVMPNGMNGIHLAQEVNEQYPRIGVLLTTGYSDMAAAAETRFPILRKPFEGPVLARAIRDAMDAKGGGRRTSHGASG